MPGELLKPGGDPPAKTEEIDPAPEMKPLVRKVLESGLVDKGAAQMMELWGYLPRGAADHVDESRLEGATKEKVTELARDLANEIEKEHHLRETYLDLEKLRWPVEITLHMLPTVEGGRVGLAGPTPKLTAVVDRMGRYYFRIQDVNPDWFVPGLKITRESPKDGHIVETIYQSQVLYIGQVGVCVQVSVESDDPNEPVDTGPCQAK
jgi:hypothetical protein